MSIYDNKYIVTSWQSMIQRCTNPSNHNYPNYGGRGIEVCAEWRSFPVFYQAMAESWFPGATLERKDNNKGYSPDNVFWLHRDEQHYNRRTNALTWELAAEIRERAKEPFMTQRKLAELYGVKQPTISDVLSGKSWNANRLTAIPTSAKM